MHRHKCLSSLLSALCLQVACHREQNLPFQTSYPRGHAEGHLRVLWDCQGQKCSLHMYFTTWCAVVWMSSCVLPNFGAWSQAAHAIFMFLCGSIFFLRRKESLSKQEKRWKDNDLSGLKHDEHFSLCDWGEAVLTRRPQSGIRNRGVFA